MKTYRKSDQQYYDDYDRYTITLLKEIEKEEKNEYPKTVMVEGEPIVITEPVISKFRDESILRLRQRESYVREMIQQDENKDRLVQRHKEPQNIECDSCGARMVVSGHSFGFRGHELLFLFDCPNGKHKSRKIVDAGGTEIVFPELHCKKCGGRIKTTSKPKKLLVTVKDRCSSCGNEEISEYDMTPDPPITKEDREKYCMQFAGQQTFMEATLPFLEIVDRILAEDKKNQEKKHYEVDKIEKLTIPKLSETLAKISERSGYTEFVLEKPTMGRYVFIDFNVQDLKERTGKESIKLLSKKFNDVLIGTNWRLQNPSVSYRMGYLTGKLKGYDDEESLLKLAIEVKEKSKNKKK